MMFQQFREHGDRCHPRESVDFVQQDLVIFGQEEIDSRQIFQPQLSEGFQCIFTNGADLCIAQTRRFQISR